MFGKIIKSVMKRFAPWILVSQINQAYALEKIADLNLEDVSQVNTMLNASNINLPEEVLEKMWNNVERNTNLATFSTSLQKEISVTLNVVIAMDFCIVLGNIIIILKTIKTIQKCENTSELVEQYVEKHLIDWEHLVDIVKNWENEEPASKVNTLSVILNQYIDIIKMLANIKVCKARAEAQKSVALIVGICTIPFILANAYVLGFTWTSLLPEYKSLLSISTGSLILVTAVQFHNVYDLNEYIDILGEHIKTVKEWRVIFEQMYKIGNAENKI